MRSRSVLALLTVTASVAVLRLAARRRAVALLPARRPLPARVAGNPAPAAVTPVPAAAGPAPAAPVGDRDAVVLPFSRPVAPAPAPAPKAAPVRCGDTGGRTKAGAPCAARGTVGGRCHHHRLAA